MCVSSFAFETIKNFNSIKVQLKPKLFGAVGSSSPTFQFHKGTIKARYAMCGEYGETLFQFHKGTIKSTDLRRCVQPYQISIP